MMTSDSATIDNALLYDIFFSGATRDWSEIGESTGLGDMILHWFCQRVLSDRLLFPETPEDRADLLFRTYALGAVLAGYTDPARIESVIEKAKNAITTMYAGCDDGDKQALDRAACVCSYELTFMDSANGCDDAINAMALAYMYMCGIPRQHAHARQLIEICYAWMYSYSNFSGVT